MNERASGVRPITVALLVTIFLISIEATVVSTAASRIVGDLGGLEMMGWIFSIYLLTTVVSTPIFGKLLDLYGRKSIFLAGLLLFVAASALSGLSGTMLQLIIFRGLQGIGAGALFPAIMTIVGVLYSEQQRAKMQAGFSAVGAISGLAGPFVGGLFVDYASWQWIFFINVPIGLVCFWLVAANLREQVRRAKVSIDYAGIVLFTIASGSLLLALSLKIGVLYIVAGVSFAIFVYAEAKSADALIPPRLFANRVVTLCYAAAFLLSTLVIGLNVYVPLWMQGVAGSSATVAGLTLAPMSVLWSVGAFWCGKLLAKRGGKTISVTGLLFILAGTLALFLMGESVPVWGLLAVMASIGLGMGLAATMMMVTIQSEAKPEQLGSAMSTLTFLNYMAQSIGIALFAALFNREAYRGKEQLQAAGVPIDDLNGLLGSHHSAQLSESALDAIRGVLGGSISQLFPYILIFAAASFAMVVLLPRSKRESAKSG